MRLQTISRYNPGNCSPALLERLLVARRKLLAMIEHDVIDAVDASAGHQWLLIGPRGSGKTHLVAVLFHRLGEREALSGRVVIAYLTEEERRVASFLDWMVSILRALADPEEAALALGPRMASLMELSPERAAERAVEILREHVGDRRLVVLTENLGQTFARLGSEGQARFRDVIQQHPCWTIVATSQALFPDIQEHDAPFYGFFKVRHIEMLSPDEAVQLLDRLGAETGREDLRRLFRTPAGRARIRAIHELAAGNPRLLVICFQLLDRSSVAQLADAFLEMVEELTAYYQEQRGHLPPVQDKIVDFLCDHRSPVAVKDIARQCFLLPQTTSKELEKLRDKRFVVRTKVGRESCYELREPLLRVSSEIKAHQGYPIRLFVDFIGRYYTIEELGRKHRVAGLLAGLTDPLLGRGTHLALHMERTYLLEAARHHHGVELDDTGDGAVGSGDASYLCATVGELVAGCAYDEAARLADTAIGRLPDAVDLFVGGARAHRELGELKTGLELAVQATEKAPGWADAWVERGVGERRLGRLDEAVASLERALTLDADHIGALVELGVARMEERRPGEARSCFERAVGLAPDNGRAWRGLGRAYGDLGDEAACRRSLAEARRCAPNDVEIWLDCAWWAVEWKSLDEASGFARHAIELDPTSAAAHAQAGVVAGRQADHVGAAALFRQATDLDPRLAGAWSNLAIAAWQLGQHEDALEAARRARELDGDDATALSIIGRASAALGQYRDAVEAFDLVLAARPGDGRTWLEAGVARGNLGDHAGAAQGFERAIELDDRSSAAWRNLALARSRVGDFAGCVEAVDRALELGEVPATHLGDCGVRAGGAGDHAAAALLFRRAVERDPESAVLLQNLALAESFGDHPERAIEPAERAIVEGDVSAQVMERLGINLANAGRLEPARRFLEQSLMVQADRDSSRALLVLVLAWLGAVDDALAEADRLTDPTAAPIATHVALGASLLEASRWEDALRFGRLATARADADDGCWALLAVAGVGAGVDDDRVLAATERALELGGDPATVWSVMGEVSLRAARPELARVALEHAVAVRPTDATAWLLLGQVQRLLDAPDLAVACFERAVALEPDDPTAGNTLGEALRQAGRYDEALDRYEAVIAHAPEACFPWFNIALTHLRADRPEAAFEALTRALAAGGGAGWGDEVALCLSDLGAEILGRSARDRVASRLARFVEAVRASRQAGHLATGLTGAVSAVLRADTGSDPAHLAAVHDALVAVTGQDLDYEVLRRWTDIASRYRASTDPRVLLELPLEERRKLTELLGVTL